MGIDTNLRVATYFSPDDDTQKVFLDFLNQAQKNVYIAIYSWHLPPAMDVVRNLCGRNVSVAFVMDHGQSVGRYESPEVAELVTLGCDITIGTSRRHAIMHDKFAVVDEEHVLAGSWNFSLSASKENNFLQIVSNSHHASLFLEEWHKMRDWMRAHEPKWQPRI